MTAWWEKELRFWSEGVNELLTVPVSLTHSFKFNLCSNYSLEHNQTTSANCPLPFLYSSTCKQSLWNDTKGMNVNYHLSSQIHFKLWLLILHLFVERGGQAGLTTYLGISQSWANREGPTEKRQPHRPEKLRAEHGTYYYSLPISSSQVSANCSKLDVNVKQKTKTRTSRLVCLYRCLRSSWFLSKVKNGLRDAPTSGLH